MPPPSSPLVAPTITLNSPFYLAGDIVTASVAFAPAQPHVLEWTGVQLHGHVWRDDRLVRGFPRPETDLASPLSSRRSPRSSSMSTTKSMQTAMADFVHSVSGAQCLFATKPMCLAADLDLSGPVPHVFSFSAHLPSVLPPTFRGVAARYWYLLTVCIKAMESSAIRVAHVPILVVGTPGSMGDAARSGPSSLVMSSRPLPLSLDQHDDDALSGEVNFFPTTEQLNNDTSLYFAAMEVSSRSTNGPGGAATSAADSDPQTIVDRLADPCPDLTFAALNASAIGSHEKLAKVVVCPSILVPGDAFTVKLDLLRPCHSVSLALEQEECALCPPPLHAAFEPLTRRRHGAGPWLKVICSTHRNVGTAKSLCVTLPTLHLSPSFSTDLVVVRTRLVLSLAVTGGETMTLRYLIDVRPQGAEPLKASFTPALVSKTSMEVVKLGTPPPTPKKLVFS